MIFWKKKLIECCKCHKDYSFDNNLFYHLKEYILICPNCNLMHKVNIQLLGKEYKGLKRVNKLNLAYEVINSYLVTSSWKCPSDVTSVKVECRGSGGGGGGVAADTNKAAGAGAGGQYVVSTTFAVTPGTTYTITIGNGGTAGASTGGNGGTGGVVWFKSNDANGVVAQGGAGGQAYENGFQGGAGSVAGGVGDTVRAGGSGGAGGAWNGSGGGGEGGNSDKVGENGGDGSSGVAGTAGGAGAGGGDGGNGNVGKLNAAGAVGTVPGGGGSGGSVGANTTNRAGGAGGKGKIVLTYTSSLPIDIGTEAIDRDTIHSSGYTFIVKDNPANANGFISLVEIWAKTTLYDCKVAIFYLVSGTNYSTRDYQAIGTVTAGSKQTFAVDLNVVAGDSIGIYFSDGYIEATVEAPGHWVLDGDRIPCTNTTFYQDSVWFGVNFNISLYGSNATLGWPHKWNSIAIGKFNGSAFKKWNGLE